MLRDLIRKIGDFVWHLDRHKDELESVRFASDELTDALEEIGTKLDRLIMLMEEQ